MEDYKPPYKITPTIINLISLISESLGRFAVKNEMRNLKLHRINRIRKIQGSLAIEGNTLGEDEIRTILDGKTVVAPIKEIQEVRNAIKAYENYSQWTPSRKEDLLAAHFLLTQGLVDDPGIYRKKGAGVMGAENQIIHVAPPAVGIPALMNDLLGWLNKSEEHPLIKSSVFHYEFEFIHPFSDGNGRMGRLWQTLILTEWNKLFEQIPIESMIFQNQRKYYGAINKSSAQGDSTPFIEFMLTTILEVLRSTLMDEPLNEPVYEPVKLSKIQKIIIKNIKQNPPITKEQLVNVTGKSRATITRYLTVLKENGIIIRVGSDKTGHWVITGDSE